MDVSDIFTVDAREVCQDVANLMSAAGVPCVHDGRHPFVDAVFTEHCAHRIPKEYYRRYPPAWAREKEECPKAFRI